MQRHGHNFGGFGLSPTPPPLLDEAARCSRRTREAQLTELPADFRLPYSSTAVLPHTNRLWEEHKNYKIDSTDDKKRDQKNPVEKKSSRRGPFRLVESDCVRNSLESFFQCFFWFFGFLACWLIALVWIVYSVC